MEAPPEIQPSDPVFLELLSEIHATAEFSCGSSYLDWYIVNRALEEQTLGLARTIVAVNDSSSEYSFGGKSIEGYLTLEASLMPTDAMPPLQDGTPLRLKQVPVVYLAYLARDKRRHGQGYGDILLVEALRRTLLTAEQIGIIGLYLYSLPEGISLYRRFGFLSFTDDPQKLFLSVNSIRTVLERVPSKLGHKTG